MATKSGGKGGAGPGEAAFISASVTRRQRLPGNHGSFSVCLTSGLLRLCSFWRFFLLHRSQFLSQTSSSTEKA